MRFIIIFVTVLQLMSAIAIVWVFIVKIKDLYAAKDDNDERV